jgi:hypothetical protein
MKLQEIKNAVDEDKDVYYKHCNYQVIKGTYEYLIICLSNDYCISLTHSDKKTMNGKEEDFFIKGAE